MTKHVAAKTWTLHEWGDGTRRSWPEPDIHSSVIGLAAQSLSAGQSVKIDTPLTLAELVHDGGDILQWGSTAFYKPQTAEILFVGKHAGSTRPYRFLRGDLVNNTWSAATDPWTTANHGGHAYDHNAGDPATGTFYHRPYSDYVIRAWDGSSWSDLPSMPTGAPISAAAIVWFPGIGLVYADDVRIRYLSGGSWTQVQTFTAGSNPNHIVAEYNSTANCVIFGSGNAEMQMRRLNSDLSLVDIANPPFNIGSSSTQGVFVSDPASANCIAWRKGTSTWAEYDIVGDAWTSLTQSSGDGSSPQTGLPNLTTSASVVACEIPDLGVTAWIQYIAGVGGDVWIYKHA